MPVSFHLDEHVANAIAIGLRRRGIDVTTTAEARLIGATDLQHLRHGVDTGRTIFTPDPDFLALAAAGTPHAGLVFCKQGSRTIGQIIDFLTLLDACLAQTDMANHIEFC
jgi:hypothetical protein